MLRKSSRRGCVFARSLAANAVYKEHVAQRAFGGTMPNAGGISSSGRPLAEKLSVRHPCRSQPSRVCRALARASSGACSRAVPAAILPRVQPHRAVLVELQVHFETLRGAQSTGASRAHPHDNGNASAQPSISVPACGVRGISATDLRCKVICECRKMGRSPQCPA